MELRCNQARKSTSQAKKVVLGVAPLEPRPRGLSRGLSCLSSLDLSFPLPELQHHSDLAASSPSFLGDKWEDMMARGIHVVSCYARQ